MFNYYPCATALNLTHLIYFFLLQNVSDQVAGYMRDPSRMIKGMQQSKSTIAIFGTVSS